MSGLFRQSVLGRLAGCADANGADCLVHDPSIRAVSVRRKPVIESPIADTPGVCMSETE